MSQEIADLKNGYLLRKYAVVPENVDLVAASRDLISAGTYAELCEKYAAANLPELNQVTNSIASYEYQSLDNSQYRRLMQATSNKKLKGSLISIWLANSLSSLAPVKQTLWLQSKAFFQFAQNFFSTNDTVALLEQTYSSFLTAECDCSIAATKGPLEAYRKACRAFRSQMADNNMSFDGEISQSNNVSTVLAIPADCLAEITVILREMRDANRRRGGVSGTGASHLISFEMWITNPNFFSVTGKFYGRRLKQDASMRAYTTLSLGANNVWSITTVSHTGERGVYLLTTAIVNYLQRPNVNEDTIINNITSHLELFKAAMADGPGPNANEIKYIETITSVLKELTHRDEWGSGDGGMSGNIQSQAANIDSLFSSLFWIIKMAKIDDHTEYVRVLSYLYYSTRDMQGKKKLRENMQQHPMRCINVLISKMSNCTKIHLPPHILSMKRLTDIVGVLGSVNILYLNTLEKPSFSNRFSLHLPPQGSNTVKMICQLHSLERLVDPVAQAEEDIYQSHHVFHQSLQMKRSLYSNTHNVRGNALLVSPQVIASV